jgi:guanylate kinase
MSVFQPLVIVGCSGSGKGTLTSYLLQSFSLFQLSVSWTTRPPRPSEIHGREYFFVTQEKFMQEVNQGKFLEWCDIFSNLYGTHLD